MLDQLRPMMRQVVLSGTATGLADRGEVYGKTGTAEFGDKTPPDSHGWFVGYQLGGPQGDIAFAVLVEAGQSSSVAVDVADAFLGRRAAKGSGRPGKGLVTGVCPAAARQLTARSSAAVRAATASSRVLRSVAWSSTQVQAAWSRPRG